MPDPMTDPLFSLLRPERQTLVVDIGASAQDGGAPFYKPMFDRALCRILGFEPYEKAFADLQAKRGPLETYLPHAIADGNEHTLHICEEGGMTSLMRPDPKRLHQFQIFTAAARVLQEQRIATRKLDDIPEAQDCDYLKIDVQGGEMMVLRNATKALAHAVAVHIEVWFVPLYENQPLSATSTSNCGATVSCPTRCWMRANRSSRRCTSRTSRSPD